MGGTAGLTGVAVAVPHELEVAPSILRSVRVVLLAGRALHVDYSILDQGLLEAKREGERRRVIVTDVHSPPQLRIGEIVEEEVAVRVRLWIHLGRNEVRLRAVL